jgi:hypothetical protein
LTLPSLEDLKSCLIYIVIVIDNEKRGTLAKNNSELLLHHSDRPSAVKMKKIVENCLEEDYFQEIEC